MVKQELDLLHLKRFEFGTDYTLSRLFLNDRFIAFVMEDAVRDDKIWGKTAIPVGRYALGLRHSPRFTRFYFFDKILSRIIPSKKGNHRLIWLKNVPNYKWILIHWGNTHIDTHGCLLVGSHHSYLRGIRSVTRSRQTYKQIYPAIKRWLLNPDYNCNILISNNIN